MIHLKMGLKVRPNGELGAGRNLCSVFEIEKYYSRRVPHSRRPRYR
jgi:hypothetical protein